MAHVPTLEPFAPDRMIHTVRLLSYDEVSEQGLKRSATDAGISRDSNRQPPGLLQQQASSFDLEGLDMDGQLTASLMLDMNMSFAIPVSGPVVPAHGAIIRPAGHTGAGGYPIPITATTTSTTLTTTSGGGDDPMDESVSGQIQDSTPVLPPTTHHPPVHQRSLSSSGSDGPSLPAAHPHPSLGGHHHHSLTSEDSLFGSSSHDDSLVLLLQKDSFVEHITDAVSGAAAAATKK